MKKEITIESDKVGIHFFYDSRSYSNKDINKLKKWLNYSVLAIESFIFKDLKHIVKQNNIKKFETNLTICGNYKIKSLNKNFRNKDKITDVLSFPLQDDVRNNLVDVFFPTVELGDIYISKEVCAKQAREFKLSFEEEFVHLLVHGILHLLGFDHEINEDEEKLMQSLESEILKKVSKYKKR